MYTCKNYVGVTCVNGNCPNALSELEPYYTHERVKCEDCFYNKGCVDCALDGTEMCEKKGQKCLNNADRGGFGSTGEK